MQLIKLLNKSEFVFYKKLCSQKILNSNYYLIERRFFELNPLKMKNKMVRTR